MDKIEKIDKSLEIEINKYLEPIHACDIQYEPFIKMAECARHFAEWKESQMLKEAVEGEICGRVYDHINVRFADGVGKYLAPKNISHIPADVSKYNIGDKVRIVVLKEEEDKR